MEEKKNNEVVKKTAALQEESREIEMSEKLFTQEEVNEIVKKRIARRKEQEKNLEQIENRATELDIREKVLACKEYLVEKGYSSKLLKIIDTTDIELFKEKVDEISTLINNTQTASKVIPLCSVNEGVYNDMDLTKAAFNNTKHVPKGYWATDPKYRKE